MRLAVRLMLVWLLSVTLPLQGLAAATMSACGAGHRERAYSHEMEHSAPAISVTHHPHGDHPRAGVHGHADAVEADHDETPFAAAAGHKCSACASCCSNAVVPADAVSFDNVELPDAFPRVGAAPLAAYLTEGLERPPRPLLA